MERAPQSRYRRRTGRRPNWRPGCRRPMCIDGAEEDFCDGRGRIDPHENKASHEKNCTGARRRMASGIVSMLASACRRIPSASLCAGTAAPSPRPARRRRQDRAACPRPSDRPHRGRLRQRQPTTIPARVAAFPAHAAAARSAKPSSTSGGYSRVETTVQRIERKRTQAPRKKEYRTVSGTMPAGAVLAMPRCSNTQGRALATTAPMPMKKLCMA